MNIQRILHFVLTTLMLVAIPNFTSLAQEPDDEDLHIHITQVDTSNFPSVTVYISVTDIAGEPVGVEPERILVQEDGKTIRPDQMQGSLGVVETLTTLLVFDVSGSMNSAGKLDTAKAAAKAYINQMRPGDQVGLLAFNTAVSYVQPITTNQTALRTAIDSLTANEDTAMYDALVETADLLGMVSGRAAIIALTDGMDNASGNGLEEVIAHIGPAGLSISTVGLGDPDQKDATLAGLDERALQTLATTGGGQYAYANDPDSLTSLYERYARVLQSEYVITYTSPGGLRDGITRNLTVSLADANAVQLHADYNPGGLVPEVSEPATWPIFFGIFLGLIALLFLPILFDRGLSILSAGKSTGVSKRTSRIRLKD